MSSSVSTLAMSSTPKPANAMLVTFSFRVSANIQPDTITTKANAVIFSSRESGPIAASAVRAAAGASGVSRTPGGKTRERIRGIATIAISAGSDAVRSHLPNPISIPKCCAIWMPIGFAEVAVIQRADETARLAMPQNTRLSAEPASLRIVGARARSLRNRQHDGVENTGAGRIARKRRRDQRIREHDAVGDAER